jgi:hypothetical protein
MEAGICAWYVAASGTEAGAARAAEAGAKEQAIRVATMAAFLTRIDRINEIRA